MERWLVVVVVSLAAGCPWRGEGDATPETQKRIYARNSLTLAMPLPLEYAHQVRAIPHVEGVTWWSFCSATNPAAGDEYFVALAVDVASAPEVYPDLFNASHREAWRRNPRGAVISDDLGARFGWKVGDRVSVTLNPVGANERSAWQFDIVGVSPAGRALVGRSLLWFSSAPGNNVTVTRESHAPRRKFSSRGRAGTHARPARKTARRVEGGSHPRTAATIARVPTVG